MDEVIDRLTKIFAPLTQLNLTILVLYRYRNVLLGI